MRRITAVAKSCLCLLANALRAMAALMSVASVVQATRAVGSETARLQTLSPHFPPSAPCSVAHPGF